MTLLRSYPLGRDTPLLFDSFSGRKRMVLIHIDRQLSVIPEFAVTTSFLL